MGDLVTHHFLFKAEAVTPLELDQYSGAALRGNLFEALWRRFCMNKDAASCAECPLHTMCPVSALVAPLREENPRGRDIPRPYILIPPLEGTRCYAPGEQFTFGLTLFGKIVELFPYIMLSISTLESVGVGRKVQEQDGRRGRFKIKKVESIQPFSGERQVIYQAGKTLVGTSTISVTAADVEQKALALPKEQITLHFLTPTRITQKEHLVRHAAFRPLIHRILERLSALQEEYGTGDHHPISRDERYRYVELAECVQCIDDATQWEELQSYSRRTRHFSPISGIMGRATFAGDLRPFLELLVWGELIHVGKNAVKGNGWYKIET